MTGTEMIVAILRVAGLAVVFGAGIPMLYALGMRAQAGEPVRDENGVVIDDTDPTPHMRALGYATYAVLAVIIVAAILWIAKDSLAYYLNWKPFGSL
ncbi:hypothetical protein [Mobiluncus porci]|uniref:Uncharacterized protein n=1 Tax=Mobiluncus porci TaxID=2652278 RepID=A0A7K0K2F7_9ACTO|nr:hypothetical protein [Mobiluncus porci]MST49667.1 hypothetical protein [Mobiluncus porci]